MNSFKLMSIALITTSFALATEAEAASFYRPMANAMENTKVLKLPRSDCERRWRASDRSRPLYGIRGMCGCVIPIHKGLAGGIQRPGLHSLRSVNWDGTLVNQSASPR